MAQRIGTVKSLTGTAKAVSPNGEERILVIGDPIFEGEIIQTASGSDINITFDSGRELSMGGEENAVMDNTVFSVEQTDPDVEALQQALLQGEDINPEATAAGDGTGTDGGFTEPFFAGRTDDRGDVSSYNLGTQFPVDGQTPDNLEEPINEAPNALPDFGFAVEEGSGFGDEYDAPQFVIGNILANDLDDGLPNLDLDVQNIFSVETGNLASANGDGTYTVQGMYGTLVINYETGEFKYTVDEDNPNVDTMNEGDSVQEVFNYVVTDGSLTDTSNLTITVNGKNDAPIANNDGEGFLIDSNASVQDVGVDTEGSPSFMYTPEAFEGAAAKYFITAEAGETVQFIWEFTSPDYLPYNDYSFVVVDGQPIQLLSSVLELGGAETSGEQTFSITFTDGGTHTVTFGTVDYGDSGFDSGLSVQWVSGGTVQDVQTIGQAGLSGDAYIMYTDGATAEELDNFFDTFTVEGIISAKEEGSTSEFFDQYDAAEVATGNVLDNDTDVDNAHEELSVIGVDNSVIEAGGSVSINGTYGVLVMNSDGSFEYTPYGAEVEGEGSAVLDALNEGQYVQETFDYTITDNQEGNPKTDTATLTITVLGTNDAPVAHADFATVIEEGSGSFMFDPDYMPQLPPFLPFLPSDLPLSPDGDGNYDNPDDQYDPGIPVVGGNVLYNDTDVDNDTLYIKDIYSLNDVEGSESGDGAFYIQGEFGYLMMFQDGTYTYFLNNSADNVQSLNEGDVVYDTFEYVVTDAQAGNPKEDISTLTITINGTNDAPVATDNFNSAWEQGSGERGQNDHVIKAVGNLISGEANNVADQESDSDVDNDVSELSIKAIDGVELGDDGFINVKGDYGVLKVYADGSYVYKPYPAPDYDGNEGARFELKSFVDSLNEGESVTETFEYTVGDNNAVNGKTDTATLTITVYGVNDAPVAVADSSTQVIEMGSGEAGEFDEGVALAEGNVLDNDSDVDNAHSELSITEVSSNSSDNTASESGGIFTIEGKYGTLTIGADGEYSYALNNDDPDTQALNEGEQVQDIFEYTVSDNNAVNGKTDFATLTINIIGTNDAPVANVDIAAQTVYGDLVSGEIVLNGEGGTLVDKWFFSFEGGDLDISTETERYGADLDGDGVQNMLDTYIRLYSVADDGSLTLVDFNDDGGYGFNSLLELQGLAEGNYMLAVGNFLLSDNEVEQGFQNDGIGDDDFGPYQLLFSTPVLFTQIPEGNSLVESTESFAGNDTVSGNALDNDTDVDGNFLSVIGVSSDNEGTAGTEDGGTFTIEGQYGTLTIGADGEYTYVLNNNDVDTQALQEGEVVQETFTYSISDNDAVNPKSAEAQIVIDIVGSNDAPSAIADVNITTLIEMGSGEAGEFDEGVALAEGNVLDNDSDVDNAHSELSITEVSSNSSDNTASEDGGIFTIEGKYGTLTIGADGEYSYALNNDDPDTQALNEGEQVQDIFEYTVSDNNAVNGKESTSTLTINIIGTNDAPVANVDIAAQAFYGDLVSGEIVLNGEGGTLVDKWFFSFEGGDLDISTETERYGADLDGDGVQNMLDTYIRLYSVADDGSLTLVDFNDDGGYGFNSLLELQGLAEGNYMLAVGNFLLSDNEVEQGFQNDGIGDDDFGPYQLLFSTPVLFTQIPEGNSLVESTESFAGNDTVSGNALDNDTDVDGNFLSVIGVSSDNEGTAGTEDGGTFTIEGQYGTLTIGADGEYTYVLNNNDADTQALQEGEVVQETFTYSISDNDAVNPKSAEAQIVIDIVGSNDAPIVSDKTVAVENGEAFFSLADFSAGGAADYEDDVSDADGDNDGSDDTMTLITIESLPEHGTLYDSDGNELGIGDQLPDAESIRYVADSDYIGTVVLGTTANSGVIGQWGEVDDDGLSRTYTASNGIEATISAYRGTTEVEVGFNNNINDQRGLGIGVEGGDDGQIELSGQESIVIEFNNPVSDAVIGLGGLGDYFVEGSSQNAAAVWEAYLNGALVATGDVYQQSGMTADIDLGDLTFDKLTFHVEANVNSSFTVQYVEVNNVLSDSFTYSAEDADGVVSVDNATVTFDIAEGEILPFNVAPVAKDDAKAVTEGTEAGDAPDRSGNVLGNDFDFEGAVKTVLSVDGESVSDTGTQIIGEYGTLTIFADGSYSYDLDDANPIVNAMNTDSTPLTDTFEYIMSDGEKTDSAELKITINGANDAPVGGDDQLSTLEDTPLVITKAQLLGNDSDVDSSISISNVGQPEHGVLVLVNGNYIYTPDPNYNGTDSFTYTLTDGSKTDTVTVEINVGDVNDAPVIAQESVSTDIYYTSETAGYNNVFGYVVLGSDGKPLSGEILVENANDSSLTSGQYLGTVNGVTAENVMLFLIADGAGHYGDLSDADITFDNSGAAPVMYIDGVQVTHKVYYTDESLNSDGYDHTVETVDADGNLVVGFEDLNNLGDRDFYDIKVKLVTNVDDDYSATYNEQDPGLSIVAPDFAIMDVDDTMMESAEIVITNLSADDIINLGTLPSGITATVVGTAADGTITINLDGSASLADYESAIKGITFSNDSDNPVEGDRNITITVNDGDAGSNTAESVISVTAENDAPEAYNDSNVSIIEVSGTEVNNSVYVFTNPSMVDMHDDSRYHAEAEGINVLKTLESQGYDPINFNGQGNPNFSGANVIVMPENEGNQSFNDINNTTKTAIHDFVVDGGSLVVNGSYGGIGLLNSVFGFHLVYGGAEVGHSYKTSDAASTIFSEGDNYLSNNSAVYSVKTWSLPSDAVAVYRDTTSFDTTVFTIKIGTGSVTYIGFDWYNAAPEGSADGGWLELMDLAVAAGVAATASVLYDALPVEGEVLFNDMDVDTDSVNLSIVDIESNDSSNNAVATADGFTIEGEYGTLEINYDGSYTYTPNDVASDAALTESFTYTVSDGDKTDTAELTFEIKAGDQNIVGTDGNDYIDGGDGADVIHAGAGDDTIVYDFNDHVVDGGEGEDTLLYSGSSINFDNIQNIEVIDMSNTTNDSINITADDVFKATDADNILTILGDAGDTVSIDASLTKDVAASDASGGFNVYTGIVDGHDVILQIDDDINVDSI